MSQKNNKQPKTQLDSQTSSQAPGKDERSSTIEELKMQLALKEQALQAERKEKKAKEQAFMAERQRAEAERKEKEAKEQALIAERERAEKAETEKVHLQKRLKRIFKRGLSIEDLGLKGIFFGFLKVLRIKTHQLISVNFSHFRSWLWFGLKKGRILAYLTTFLLILAIFIPSAFLIGQLSKLITQNQPSQQQTQQQHFSTGELNLADTAINLSATAVSAHTHAHTAQTKADFEGTIPNEAKGFGYGTSHPPGKVVPVTGPEISPDASTVGLWHMNSGFSAVNDVIDSSGNGNNGTATGATLNTTDQKLGAGAGSFSGGTNRVDASSNINSLKSAVGTIEVWFKSSVSGNTLSFSQGETGGTFNFLAIGDITGDYPDESLGFFYRSSGANVLGVYYRQGHNFYLDNQWHHLVFVMGSNFHKLYVDGEELLPLTYFAGSSTTGNCFSNDANFNTFTIGNYKLNNAYTYPFVGLLDEVAIYNRALSRRNQTTL